MTIADVIPAVERLSAPARPKPAPFREPGTVTPAD